MREPRRGRAQTGRRLDFLRASEGEGQVWHYLRKLALHPGLEFPSCGDRIWIGRLRQFQMPVAILRGSPLPQISAFEKATLEARNAALRSSKHRSPTVEQTHARRPPSWPMNDRTRRPPFVHRFSGDTSVKLKGFVGDPAACECFLEPLVERRLTDQPTSKRSPSTSESTPANSLSYSFSPPVKENSRRSPCVAPRRRRRLCLRLRRPPGQDEASASLAKHAIQQPCRAPSGRRRGPQ